jgi:thioredoxin-dependent peroxiredoxin
MNLRTVGSKAPSFSLYNQDNALIESETYLGQQKILLYFYPKALTPGCTTQACNLRDTQTAFTDKKVKVMGISPDKPDKLKKFADKYQLNFDLLADEDHKIADEYGVWGEKKFMGKTFDGIHRISFLIDEQGIIEQVFTQFKTGDHHEVVLAAISK